ncbi:hypothetical protein L2E82_35605 [Cichorium intybus]|uniref:Uncharacterized protein n=1 Tax=Cichorium intybus TaxID=13427 RepID=A0ACB9BP86_CICIN|nr:hypothetical protein L2E82_35605 [Cichorium intybus]
MSNDDPAPAAAPPPPPPPESQRGSLSKVEGILVRSADELQALQDERKVCQSFFSHNFHCNQKPFYRSCKIKNTMTKQNPQEAH